VRGQRAAPEGAMSVRSLNLWLAAGLILAVCGYAALWPRDLYFFDEGLFLYEAQRLLQGDVFYRDFFEISAPLSFYVMAAAMWACGSPFVTGRALMAGLHAAIAVLIYSTARRLGVRPTLAFVVALLHPALAYAALPFASPHWFGAALSIAVVRLALSPRPRARPGWLGVLVGLLVAAQHQKGIVLGIGVAAVLGLDAAVAERSALAGRRLGGTLAWYTIGIAAVVGPVVGLLLASAGARPMYDALIRFPLAGYREYHRGYTWGQYLGGPHGSITAHLLTYLPLALLLTLVSGLRGRLERRAGGNDAARDRVVLGVLGGFVVLSIAYNPDAVHLAFVAPIALVAAAERLEAGLQWLARRRGAGAVPAVTAVLGILVCALMVLNLHTRRAAYPIRAMTVLGPIDFADRNEPVLIETVRARLDDAPLREVFAYPFYASLYLLAEARNPTRFEVLKPGYNSPEQIAEAISALEARKTPYVVVQTLWIDWTTDPVVQYLTQHYDRVALPRTGTFPTFALFRRRP
jgi:hypothetical protein